MGGSSVESCGREIVGGCCSNFLAGEKSHCTARGEDIEVLSALAI